MWFLLRLMVVPMTNRGCATSTILILPRGVSGGVHTLGCPGPKSGCLGHARFERARCGGERRYDRRENTKPERPRFRTDFGMQALGIYVIDGPFLYLGVVECVIRAKVPGCP